MMKITACLILLMPLSIAAQDTVGDKIVEYTLSKEGKKIDRGECWDLVSEALNRSGANWDPPTGFGDKIDYTKDEVLPGDIIELKNAKISADNWTYQFPQHYAVIVEVLGDRRYRIGHQNYNNKRKVGLMELNLNYLRKGKVTVYRPG